jgi:DNA phosphorothioation-associated putative methyltransferase
LGQSPALEKGLELLYAAGDEGEIELACEGLQVGWQDEQALYIHRSLLSELPPVLRAYVGCATSLFGDVAQADVIKPHKASGKVTFLIYDDSEGKPLPELRQRIKVNLRTQWVQVFDHSAGGQLLYFKERFVAADHAGRAGMEAFSAKVRKLGVDEKTVAAGACPLGPRVAVAMQGDALDAKLLATPLEFGCTVAGADARQVGK